MITGFLNETKGCGNKKESGEHVEHYAQHQQTGAEKFHPPSIFGLHVSSLYSTDGFP